MRQQRHTTSLRPFVADCRQLSGAIWHLSSANLEQATIMAQGKKRATGRKRKATTRRKTRKASKSVRGKSVKRAVAKPTPRKRLAGAKLKRGRVKKVAPKRARPVKPPSTPAVETVVVDVIEEPVPGVITVTEFEETEERESEGPEGAEENGSAPPEPEEQ